MRTIAIGAAMILALLVPISSNYSYAQQGSPSGQSGGYGCCGRATGPGGWYCPWMGGYGGYHHGRGGTSYYNQGGQPAGGPSSYNQGGQPLSKAQAEQLVKDYYIQDNPNLKIGGLADEGDFYDATIVTKKGGALVQKIQVDKKTGWFRNVQ